MKREEVLGNRYGRLVVVGEDTPDKFKHRRVVCQCDCGSTKTVALSQLREHKTRSCGCLQSEAAARITFSHGQSHSPAYQSWASAVQRTSNPKNPLFPRYGGRGITMCERWRNSFQSFVDDMGSRPDGTSIDRIDNERGYEPGNCRWADDFEQSRNRRNVRSLTLRALTLKVHQWEHLTGLTARLIRQRKGYGWSDEKTLTQPVRMW